MIEYLMETQRIRLLSLWKEASGNWRGETTCREYRREQLLTPTAHQSAVRLGKAKRTRLRMIRLYIGLTLQRRESSTLSTDAYLLAKCLHLVLFFFFCSIPEVKAGCLPSVLFEAQINQTDCPSHTIRRDLLVTLTCCKLLLLFCFFYLNRTSIMASLYQRFTGKINTTNSFPHPPEASHLLGGQVADEENAAKTPQQLLDGRPHVQYRKKCLREDEDVRNEFFLCCLHA